MDQAEAYRRVWQRFRTFAEVVDGRHDTADWRGQGGPFAVCVVRVPAGALQPALDECRAALSDQPFVRWHPDHFLHISLQELGFVCDTPARPDEISPARLEEFATAAASALADRGPLEIHLGGVNSFQDAVFLDVDDHGACHQLHRRLNDVAAVPRASRFAFLPHTTIAHYTDVRPIGDIPATLAPWRDIRFGTFTVRQIEIVTLGLTDPYPPLEPYAVIPLAE